MKKLKTNSMIFVVAVLLSVVLFYATKNPELFSASVLSLQDAETIKAKSRDVGYKNEGNMLDTFISNQLKNIDNIDNIVFSIIYNDSDISLDIPHIKSQTTYDILSDTKGGLVIKFTDFSGIDYDYNQSLFELPFIINQGQVAAVLISEGSALLYNGDQKSLSIGLLNSDSQNHSK